MKRKFMRKDDNLTEINSLANVGEGSEVDLLIYN